MTMTIAIDRLSVSPRWRSEFDRIVEAGAPAAAVAVAGAALDLDAPLTVQRRFAEAIVIADVWLEADAGRVALPPVTLAAFGRTCRGKIEWTREILRAKYGAYGFHVRMF